MAINVDVKGKVKENFWNALKGFMGKIQELQEQEFVVVDSFTM